MGLGFVHNQNVIPQSIFSLYMFCAHIKILKYIFNYVYKVLAYVTIEITKTLNSNSIFNKLTMIKSKLT